MRIESIDTGATATHLALLSAAYDLNRALG
jgi:hypothetical protein